MLAISFAVAFVLTCLCWKESPEDSKETTQKIDGNNR